MAAPSRSAFHLGLSGARTTGSAALELQAKGGRRALATM